MQEKRNVIKLGLIQIYRPRECCYASYSEEIPFLLCFEIVHLIHLLELHAVRQWK